MLIRQCFSKDRNVMMKKGRIGIIKQISLLFIIGILASGSLTYVTQRATSEGGVKREREKLASQIVREVKAAVTEYPGYEWLLHYWYIHHEDLDIEYDTDFREGLKTKEKCRVFNKNHPDLQLKYLDSMDIKALPKEDQKLYAEITYSWLITRINQIKRTYQVDYLFCVLSDETYEKQFFLFSAADEDSVRGSHYLEVYPLGIEVTVSESQQEAMRSAKRNKENLADAGEYVDYYSFFGMVDGNPLFIGMTYNLSEIMKVIKSDTVSGSFVAMTYQLFLSGICLALILFIIIRPLKKIQKNIRIYRDSKNSEKVTGNLSKVQPNNEIGELSQDVISLVEEIDNHVARISAITAEKERIGAELALATRIQADMLPNVFPPFPDRDEFDIYAAMEPAKEVGGDFYDFFLIDDDHLCMVMADVSGKGIPAALFMMACKIILANNAMMHKSPAEILSDTNDTICSNNKEEMFVTVWVGILEISTGRLTAANAGHEYPVMKTPEGRFELLKDRHSFVIGGMEDMPYKDYEVQMLPGTSLFLYTDGVPEATDGKAELYGTDRMLDALNADPEAAPRNVLENVKKDVAEFVGEAEQFDDLTMLCMVYKGKKSN